MISFLNTDMAQRVETFPVKDRGMVNTMTCRRAVAYFTKAVYSSITKPPLNYNDNLARIGLRFFLAY